MTFTLYEDFTFTTVSRWILLRMSNVPDYIRRENLNMHFMFKTFFRKSCHLWDNVEKYSGAREATDENTIRRMCVTCWKSRSICASAHAQEAHARAHPHTQACTHEGTCAHTYMKYLLFFHCNNGFVNTLISRYTCMAYLVSSNTGNVTSNNDSSAVLSLARGYFLCSCLHSSTADNTDTWRHKSRPCYLWDPCVNTFLAHKSRLVWRGDEIFGDGEHSEICRWPFVNQKTCLPSRMDLHPTSYCHNRTRPLVSLREGCMSY